MLTDDRIRQLLHETVAAFPRAWQQAHHDGDPERWDWIVLAVDRLYREDNAIRGNWRRGDIGDLSMDGISVLIDGEWRFADVIVGAGGSSPSVAYRTPGSEAALRNRSGQYIGEAGAPAPDQIRQHHGWTHHDYSGGGEPPPTTRAKLGASLFSLVDLYQHDRNRADQTIRWYRDQMGVTFLRVFWRKGTGTPGDYWNNGPYYSLVRTDLLQLPVSLMREVMDYTRSFGLTIAHCIFADNLGMSITDQDRFRDGFLQAEGDYRDITEYIEVFNEPYTYGGGHGGDIPTLHRHARNIRAAVGSGVLVSLGTPHAVHAGGNIEAEVRDMYGACPEANLITVHFSRDTNRPPYLGSFAPERRSSGEPRGPGSSVSQTTDPAALIGDFRATQSAGYEWYVYHSDPGIRPRSVEVWQVQNADAIAAAFRSEVGTSEPLPHPPPPAPPAVKSTLEPGEELQPNGKLTSPDGHFTLEYQGDGNLVLYEWQDGNGLARWNTETAGTEPFLVAMQGDGNFVVYARDSGGGEAVWSSNTFHPNSTLELADDGVARVTYTTTATAWSSRGPVSGPSPEPPPPPPPPPARTTAEVWLWPNIGSDVQRLFTEPAMWPITRREIAAFSLHPAWLTFGADHPHRQQMRLGPNTSEAMKAAGVWDRLREWGTPIGVDFVGLASFDPTGNASVAAFLEDFYPKMRAENLSISFLSISEPYKEASAMGMSDEEATAITARHVMGLRTLGIPSVGLTEAYPYVSASRIVRAMHAFETAQPRLAARLNYLHLDIDWWAPRPHFGPDLRQMRDACKELGVMLGIIATVGRAGDDAQFTSWTRQMVSAVRSELGGEPDRWIVTSWWPRGDRPDTDPSGVKDMPVNGPETEPTSLTGLARSIGGF